MCLISWERTQKRDPRELFRGDFGVKNGDPNGPFSAPKSLMIVVVSCPSWETGQKKGGSDKWLGKGAKRVLSCTE